MERFVLSGFTASQLDVFQDNLDRIVKGINLFVEQGVKTAMNSVNAKIKLEQ